MALTQEQVQELKKQLSEQIQHLPPNQKDEAQKQIDNMSSEALESMLNQQKKEPQESIFRAIISGKIPSKKIDENKESIAVLDIKPISKGHTIIIPKNPCKSSKDLKTPSFSLAKKISKKIISKLKAQGTEIQTEFKFGETIINIIPIYDKPLTISSERYDASEKELNEVFLKLRTIKKPKTIKIKKAKPTSKEIIKLNRKIP